MFHNYYLYYYIILNSNLYNDLENVRSNFTSAADAIGAALVAKDIEVPEGTSLLEMADLINNLDSLHKEYTIVYNIETNTYYSEKIIENNPILYPTTFTPTKSDWEFVGWRKDNTASSSVLSNETATSSITLFAVFRQAVTCTFKSYNKSQTVTGYRYYNNGNVTNASIKAPTGATMSGWTWRGWLAANTTTGNASVAYANGATISGLTGNATYYGLYSLTITLSYAGNGSTSGSTAVQTGTRYWNASGTYVNPSFTLTSNGFTKTNYAFVKWAQGSTSGTQYSAGASVTLTANTTYYAIWNQVILGVMALIGGGWSGATSANQLQVYVDIGGGSDCDEVNKTIRSSNFNIDSKYQYITISGSTSGYRLNHARLYYSNGSKYKDISVTGKTNIAGITGSCYISIGVGNLAVGNGAYWAEAHYYVTGVKLSVS